MIGLGGKGAGVCEGGGTSEVRLTRLIMLIVLAVQGRLRWEGGVKAPRIELHKFS